MANDTASSNITQKEIEFYIDNELNVLLQGPHGVGKTQMLTESCHNLGLNLKYFSASTLDPYTDLVGVPYPVDREDGSKELLSIRPRAIDEANVIFFDELNRAEPKVHNALMEIIQFGTINGEELPNLKCVIAAQNPPEDDYNVIPLDPALVDRFEIVADVANLPDKSYLTAALSEQYGDEGVRVAAALMDWVKEHKPDDTEHPEYISPRKIEKIGRMYLKFNSQGVGYSRIQSSLEHAMPPGQTWDHGRLLNLLAGDPTLNPDNSDYDYSNADPAWLYSDKADPAKIADWLKNEKDYTKRTRVLGLMARGRQDIVAKRWSLALNNLTKREYEKCFNYTDNPVRQKVFRFNIETADQTPEITEEARERLLKWIPEVN